MVRLTPAKLQALRDWSDPFVVSASAYALGFTMKVVNGLLVAGLLERDPSDSLTKTDKYVRMRITPAGRQALEAHHEQ